MSSTYNLICVTHIPAIVIGHEFSYEEIDKFDTRDHPALSGHQWCDVLAGAFSYPLVRVKCFGRSLYGPSGCRGIHNNLVGWEQADLLRLLFACLKLPGSPLTQELEPFVGHCWTKARLISLSGELGVQD
jgi:hypothetical protein